MLEEEDGPNHLMNYLITKVFVEQPLAKPECLPKSEGTKFTQKLTYNQVYNGFSVIEIKYLYLHQVMPLNLKHMSLLF